MLPVQGPAEDLRAVNLSPCCISPAREGLPLQAGCSALLYLRCSVLQAIVLCYRAAPFVDGAPLDVVHLSSPLCLQKLLPLPTIKFELRNVELVRHLGQLNAADCACKEQTAARRCEVWLQMWHVYSMMSGN